MSATLKVYVNTALKVLQYSSTSGRIVNLPDFRKYETVPLEIMLVEPDPTNQIDGFIVPDISNMSLRVALHSAWDATTPIAQQETWSKDTVKRTFTAELTLNTTDFNTWIGSSESKVGYFEIEVLEGTARRKVYVSAVNVKNAVQKPTTTAPSPITEYITRAEANATFAKYLSAAGMTITLTSADGTKQRIIGVGNDGTAFDDITTV